VQQLLKGSGLTFQKFIYVAVYLNSIWQVLGQLCR